MKGVPGSEPAGTAGECFFVLAMYGNQAGHTAAELHELIARENEGFDYQVPTPAQVRSGLLGLTRLRPPLAELVPGSGLPRNWRITNHGYAMLKVWCGDDADPRDRKPCGLGWPA